MHRCMRCENLVTSSPFKLHKMFLSPTLIPLCNYMILHTISYYVISLYMKHIFIPPYAQIIFEFNKINKTIFSLFDNDTTLW